MVRRIPRKTKKKLNNDFRNMPEDIRRDAVNALRNAAKEVLNDLAQASPNWSGTFKKSWYVETPDGKRGARSGSNDGTYNLFNIPQLNTQGRNARGQFASTAPTSRSTLFIGNSVDYATQAMDLEPGDFFYPGFEPAGPERPRGERQQGIRGFLKAPGGNRSTAPLDWYSTYMNGGQFRAAFNRGAKAGFLEARNRPRSIPR
jgi:hypothetical protein